MSPKTNPKANPEANLKTSLKALVEKALLALASEIKLTPDLLQQVKEALGTLELESIREESFGDYACTVAMEKSFRECYTQAQVKFRNPREFALAICARL